MSDDSSDHRDRSPTTASFEEWLDRQAESQGVSRQELFERLVSSYWTLNELVQLLDDSGNTASLADIYPGDDPESPDGRDTGATPTISGSGREDDDGQRQEDREAGSELRTRVEELDDRIDDLESELGDERERGQSQDGLIEALADRLSGIEADLDELESESASGRESLSDGQAALERRLDELETDLGGRQKQLASEQERLRSRLNSEFDELETILRYLVSETDDLDAGLAAVEQRHDEALSQLQWEREAMRSLLGEASAHDAHVGECEVCGDRVNLGLLAEPYCPECDSLLTGIEEHDKWLFLSDIVVTAEETPAAGRVASATATGPSEPTPESSTPPDTGSDPGERPPGASTGTDTRRTTPHPADAEPTQSETGGRDGPGSPREPDPDPRSGDATDDASEPTDSGVLDFGADTPAPESGSSSGSDAAPSEGDDSGSPFSSDDGALDPESSSGAENEPDSGDESVADVADGTAVDAPFGDLDDLKRQEESDEE